MPLKSGRRCAESSGTLSERRPNDITAVATIRFMGVTVRVGGQVVVRLRLYPLTSVSTAMFILAFTACRAGWRIAINT